MSLRNKKIIQWNVESFFFIECMHTKRVTLAEPAFLHFSWFGVLGQIEIHQIDFNLAMFDKHPVLYNLQGYKQQKSVKLRSFMRLYTKNGN